MPSAPGAVAAPQLAAFALGDFRCQPLVGFFERLDPFELRGHQCGSLRWRHRKLAREFLQGPEVGAGMAQRPQPADEFQPRVAANLFGLANHHRPDLRGSAHVRPAASAAVDSVDRHDAQRARRAAIPCAIPDRPPRLQT